LLQRSPGVVAGDRWRGGTDAGRPLVLQRSPGVVAGDRFHSRTVATGSACFNGAPASWPGIAAVRRLVRRDHRASTEPRRRGRGSRRALRDAARHRGASTEPRRRGRGSERCTRRVSEVELALSARYHAAFEQAKYSQGRIAQRLAGPPRSRPNPLISDGDRTRERVGGTRRHLAARERSSCSAYSAVREHCSTSDHVGLAPLVYIRLAEALEHLFTAPLGRADIDE
jgi:hypothetical protein